MFRCKLGMVAVFAILVLIATACQGMPQTVTVVQTVEVEKVVTVEVEKTGGEEAGPIGERVQLQWAVEWPDARTISQVDRYIFGPFEKANPDIKINIIRYPSGDALAQAMAAELAAGGGPDIFDTNGPSWVAPHVEAGTILNLQECAEKNNWDDKILQFAWDASLINGELYSLPAAYEGLLLWYNQDMFEEKGWEVPQTYDELVALSQEIQAEGLIPIAFGTATCKPCWEWWISYAMGAYLGPTKFYQVVTGEIPWTDPDVVTAFQMLKDFYDQGFIMDKQETAIGFDDSWGMWGQQQAVMRVEGTWGFDFAENYAQDFEYGVAPLPGWREGIDQVIPIGIGESVVINANTQFPDESCRALDWMVSDPEYLGTWAGKVTSAFVPPVQLERDQYAPDTNQKLVDIMMVFNEAMDAGQASYVAWTAFPAQTDAYAWNNMEDVLLDRLSIEDYLAGIQKQFDEEKAEGKLPTVPAPAPDAP